MLFYLYWIYFQFINIGAISKVHSVIYLIHTWLKVSKKIKLASHWYKKVIIRWKAHCGLQIPEVDNPQLGKQKKRVDLQIIIQLYSCSAQLITS